MDYGSGWRDFAIDLPIYFFVMLHMNIYRSLSVFLFHVTSVRTHLNPIYVCTFAMHMHMCTVPLSLSAYARTVQACAHVHVPLVMQTISQCDTCT